MRWPRGSRRQREDRLRLLAIRLVQPRRYHPVWRRLADLGADHVVLHGDDAAALGWGPDTRGQLDPRLGCKVTVTPYCEPGRFYVVNDPLGVDLTDAEREALAGDFRAHADRYIRALVGGEEPWTG